MKVSWGFSSMKMTPIFLFKNRKKTNFLVFDAKNTVNHHEILKNHGLMDCSFAVHKFLIISY